MMKLENEICLIIRSNFWGAPKLECGGGAESDGQTEQHNKLFKFLLNFF